MDLEAVHCEGLGGDETFVADTTFEVLVPLMENQITFILNMHVIVI